MTEKQHTPQPTYLVTKEWGPVKSFLDHDDAQRYAVAQCRETQEAHEIHEINAGVVKKIQVVSLDVGVKVMAEENAE